MTDEPINVLPARAGMSPALAMTESTPSGAPRSRGDEPSDDLIADLALLCSPLARG